MGQLLTPTKRARSSKFISKLLVSGKEISADKQIATALTLIYMGYFDYQFYVGGKKAPWSNSGI